MSRVRPTRDETRAKLVRAAFAVFERKGIGGSRVDDIVAEAGFTRGAFYSSFDSMDDLVLSVIDECVDASMRLVAEVRGRHSDPLEFLAEMRRRGGGSSVAPEGLTPVLNVELMLYALRNPANRQRLVDRLRTIRSRTADVVRANLGALLDDGALDAEQIAAMINAMDDGLAVHRMIDPESFTDDTFWDWVTMLQSVAARPSGDAAARKVTG